MKSFRVVSLVLAFATILLLQTTIFRSEASAVPIFSGDSGGALHSIDSVTGTPTLIGSMGVTMFDIAQDVSGSLFGVSGSGGLYSVDTTTAVASLIGTGGNFLNGLAFDSTGTLFGSGGTGLYTVNTTTGDSTLVGLNGLGIASSGDIAFAPNGDLFLTASGSGGDNLVMLDPSSGAGTLIGNTGFSGVFGLVYDGAALLGLTSGGSLISIDTSTGAGSFIASTGVTTFGASTPTSAAVPEPATFILLGSGLIGMFVFRNKIQKDV